MKSLRQTLFVLALSAAAFAPSASAQVVNSGNVGTLRTFQDVNTGRIWLDMDNFFGMSANQMFAIASSAGFTGATQADVNQLFSGLPLGSGQWSSYAAVMGSAPNRSLIWGAFDVTGGTNPVGWAWAYSADFAWNVYPNSDNPNSIPNCCGPDSDLNLWAYQDATSTPEPASFILLGTGLLGVAGVARRRRNRAT